MWRDSVCGSSTKSSQNGQILFLRLAFVSSFYRKQGMEPFFGLFVRNTVVLFTSMQTIAAFHQGGSSATSYVLVFGPGRSLCSRRRWSWCQTCRCLLWLLLRVVHKQLLCSWRGGRGRGLFWHSPLVLWGQTVGWRLEAGLCDSGAALMAAVQTALEGRSSSWIEQLAAVCAAQPDPPSASCWTSPAALVPSCVLLLSPQLSFSALGSICGPWSLLYSRLEVIACCG